jgi:hypothetical protein
MMAATLPAVTKRLDDATADRLAKILGMLGSQHPGERAAAAAKASAIVRAAGLTWRDVVVASPSVAPQPEDDTPDWRQMAARCAQQIGRLTAREAGFVRQILTWSRPTPKQMAWLEDIHARLQD